ncbi:MAG: RHS repeat-associated core domain-containing protein, partial [Archangium sp.]|nr:RHS repeat-associated core domain-containing protein [Archangium sp.]
VSESELQLKGKGELAPGPSLSTASIRGQQGSGLFLESENRTKYDYDRTTVNTARYFPPLRFPGQYYDSESDLHENWNRYYDPLTGRYLSPEPLLQSPVYLRRMAQGGMSVPTFAYAANNPVMYLDPTGRAVWVDPSNAQVWSQTWNDIVDAMQDPVIGFAVTEMVLDPSYTVFIWPNDDLPDWLGGLTSPRQHQNACDVQLGKPGTSPNGVRQTRRGNLWHEFGHAVWLWRWGNKNIAWRPQVSGGDELPFFVAPWMKDASNREALRFGNRSGAPWQDTHF